MRKTLLEDYKQLGMNNSIFIAKYSNYVKRSNTGLFTFQGFSKDLK